MDTARLKPLFSEPFPHLHLEAPTEVNASASLLLQVVVAQQAQLRCDSGLVLKSFDGDPPLECPTDQAKRVDHEFK
jgi:hypothetical protein